MLPCFIEIPFLNANSVDSNQTPRSAASDLSLRCLQMSLLRDARYKRVKKKNNSKGEYYGRIYFTAIFNDRFYLSFRF